MDVSGQLHAPAALPPRKNSVTHHIGGWVGPRAGLDGFGKQKMLFLLLGFEPGIAQLGKYIYRYIRMHHLIQHRRT
jgi:hypothetical protein